MNAFATGILVAGESISISINRYVCIKAEQTACKNCFMDARPQICCYWLHNNILEKINFLLFLHHLVWYGQLTKKSSKNREKHYLYPCGPLIGSTCFTWVLDLTIAAPFIIESQNLIFPGIRNQTTLEPKLLSRKNKTHRIEYQEQLKNIICASPAQKFQQNQFCCKRGIDTIQIDELKVIKFLRWEYDRGFFS